MKSVKTHGTHMEQRGDHYARLKILSVKGPEFNPARSVSPIGHILNSSTDVLAYLADFEDDYFGALSAAFQAGMTYEKSLERRRKK